MSGYKNRPRRYLNFCGLFSLVIRDPINTSRTLSKSLYLCWVLGLSWLYNTTRPMTRFCQQDLYPFVMIPLPVRSIGLVLLGRNPNQNDVFAELVTRWIYISTYWVSFRDIYSKVLRSSFTCSVTIGVGLSPITHSGLGTFRNFRKIRIYKRNIVKLHRTLFKNAINHPKLQRKVVNRRKQI